MTAVRAKFAALKAPFRALPADLPHFEVVRTRFYGTDEALGRMSAKITWLSERLEAAVRSGNQQELDKVNGDIQSTHEDIAKVDKIALEMTHLVPKFQRLHQRLLETQAAQAAGSAAAASSSVPPQSNVSPSPSGDSPAATPSPPPSSAPPQAPPPGH